jgi:hypothetical protein
MARNYRYVLPNTVFGSYIVKIEQSRPYARLTGVRLNIYNGERIREI